MTEIINTIQNSINELIGNGVKIFPALISALIIIALTRYGAEFSHKVAKKIVEKTVKSHSLQLLFLKSTYILTWIVGILIASIVAFPGLSLGDIIATLGLGSVAIGFAFQDIFKNFLAGILILLEEPFVIQDQIQVDDYEGTVENINIRTTEIKTYQGEKILIPNSTVFTSAIKVRTAFPYRRTDFMVGVDYNTSLPQAKAILEKIILTIEGVVHEPTPEIDLVAFNDSSIDLVVRYWTHSRQADVRRIQTKVVTSIKQAFDNQDIVIPYPIRTVYHFDQEKFNDYLPPAG
ncbi:mechanosensitive ion channel family protein [Cyanobacterium sp. IPPAS B-1200]|uniref:mechanosensitive ion channel family protein n=1 Tax=Cyanobacterium sp. IPPAS B-1200 TaxID=1562720 RepID=UPI0008524AF7|nr:mechanosensitive ion channel family protein [Cyanobacterium sp. IPPAS B-1200]OEJ78340.1 mechanosensitive ion channel protein MscS [Cyanobacterium sp. IPPAS B-1200]